MAPRRRAPHRLLTLPEAAAAVGLGVSTIRRHIRRGRVRATRVRGKYGAEYRISPAALTVLGLPVRLPPPDRSSTAPHERRPGLDRLGAGQLAVEVRALRHELSELRDVLAMLATAFVRERRRRPVRRDAGR